MVPVFLLACARGGAPRMPEPRAAPPGEAEVLLWVREDTVRASAAGAGPPLVVANGAGASGDTLGGRIDVAEDDCVLVLARGSPSVEDLDVFVYADDGAVLGADDRPTVGGSVLVCPPHPRHVYAFGRLAAGHGLVTVSAQLVRRAAAEAAARAVGARGDSTLGPIADQGWPGLDDALAAHRRTLGASFRDVRRVAAPLDARIGTRLSIATDADECLDIFVLPSEDVAFVEVTVLDGDGRIVARAANDERSPSILLCAPAHTDLTVELRPHAGRGLAAVVIGANDDPMARKGIGGQTPVTEMFPTVGLADARRDAQKRLGALGYPPARLITEGTSAVGVRAVTRVDVPQGCSRLDVMAGTPARVLDGWLWSSAGALIAHDTGTSGAVLFACGATPNARLDVEATARGGPYAVEMRSIRDAPAIFGEHPLAASRLLGRLAAADVLRTPRDAGDVKRLGLDSATLATERGEIQPGACLVVAAALDAGSEGAELRLVDAGSDGEVAVARGTYSSLAEACAAGPKPLELRIEIRLAAGRSDALFTTLSRAIPRPRR